MKKICLISMVMLVSMAMLAFGGGKTDTNVINIGYLVMITGDSALWGQDEMRGAEIAADEINKAGGIMGKKLNLQFYDGRSNAADSVNAVRRAVEQDKMIVMLGANLSGPSIACGPILAQNKVPQIASFATNTIVTQDENGKVKPWSFRLCFTDPYQGTVISSYSYNKLGHRRAAIIYDVTSDYSSGLSEVIEKNFIKLGGQIVAKHAFRGGDQDFRALVTTVKASNPEVLFLPNMWRENTLIAKQASELGMKVTMMSGDSYSPAMFELFPELDNYFVIEHFSWDDPNLQDILKKYQARHGTTVSPELNVPMGYDMVYFIKAIIEGAGSTDPETMRKAIENAKNIKLNHATITMDPATHNPLNKDAVIVKMANGVGTFVERFTPPK